MDAYGLLGVSCDSLWFPVTNSETFRADGVSCGVAVVVEGDGALRFSLSLSPNVLPDSPMWVDTCIPLLLHVLLNLSPSPWMYVATMKMFLLLLLLLVPLLLLCLLLGRLLSLVFGPMLLFCLHSLCSICWLEDTNWPCVPICCKHCVWPWWSGHYPNVDIDLYVLVFYRLWWWGCVPPSH